MRQSIIVLIALVLLSLAVLPYALPAVAETYYDPRNAPAKDNAEALEPEPEASLPQLPFAPLCFDGEADYAYVDATLSIHIKKIQEENLVYFICDIQTTDPTALKVGLSGDHVYGSYESTSDIARRNGAVLAVCGDCYGYHKNGVIIRNGQLIRANNTTRHMLILDENGNLSTISDRKGENPKELANRLVSENVQQTREFGPVLIRDGQAVPFSASFDLLPTHDKALEPRTAIGQIDALHYVILVVDGRISGYSRGASLQTLQTLLLQAGAKTAFNLDGGGSTTLYFNGQVINRPSSGVERSVTDIIYF